MITITRDGSKVKATFQSSIGWEFYFTASLSDDGYAEYLKRDIQEKLYKKLADIRKAAYNQGWSDKQKRKVKRQYFCSGWEASNV